ncbi:MAG: Z1 domain-containing protein [Planctomycetaceae bacterium]|jgi:hypothetical protein|nr:Z1 domain-containing protein [Planctomycetaceae bacterium]
MTFLKSYLNTIKIDEVKQIVKETADEFSRQVLDEFDFQSRINGLLLGEVQSGKTGQMLGIIAESADKGVDVFIVLTTDNNRLQKQTYKRALDGLMDAMCVCSEDGTVPFQINKMRQPVVIVLKKNTTVLKKWRNELLATNYLKDRVIMIIDDEADAASLNTRINQDDISVINQHINDIRSNGHSCIYLQVTATPQAVLLQTEESAYKPSFVIYFRPGKTYLGGDFFFSKPEPYCIIEIDSTEMVSVIDPDSEIDSWLNQAILNFLVVCAHCKLTGIDVCNFLIHPSTKIKDHNTVSEKISRIFNDIWQGLDDNDNSIKAGIKSEWNNLYTTKPEIQLFDDICDCIKDLLCCNEINRYVMNSKTDTHTNVETGYNIVIGGNILGRGITFPNLQTVYYSRTAKTIQADTYWQHCRMFGYDRDRGLIRLFMPFSVFKRFQELNESQKVLVKQITEKGLDAMHILYANGIKPTRNNVIDGSQLSCITGGVNYFAAFPVNKTLSELDTLLGNFIGKKTQDVKIDLIIQILSHIESEKDTDWDSLIYIQAIKMIADKEKIKDAKLFVSSGHKISRKTGTMLTPTNRKEFDNYDSSISLIMYRLTGEVELGWNGQPLWMPNIKLPNGFVFYKMDS